MRQVITLNQWAETPPRVQAFIISWKKRKGYAHESPLLTLGQAIELSIAFGYRFHQDFSDGRFFNNILINEECVIAWDGDELLDTLYYAIVQDIKKRMAHSTFNDLDPSTF
jgi:hypothetical protein